MAGCSAIKPDRERCRGIAATGSEWCPAHDPARAEARRRAATKAARSKGGASAEVKDLKDHVRVVIGGVLGGKIDRRVASVAMQGFNTLLRAVEVQRRLRETEELEERLEAVEAALAERSRGGRYGAV